MFEPSIDRGIQTEAAFFHFKGTSCLRSCCCIASANPPPTCHIIVITNMSSLCSASAKPDGKWYIINTICICVWIRNIPWVEQICMQQTAFVSAFTLLAEASATDIPPSFGDFGRDMRLRSRVQLRPFAFLACLCLHFCTSDSRLKDLTHLVSLKLQMRGPDLV